MTGLPADPTMSDGPPRRGIERNRLPWIAGLVVAGALIATVGWRLGDPDVIEVAGKGQWLSDHDAVNLGSDDWSYGWVAETRWIDAAGSWHEGGRPDCVPEDGRTVPVRFVAQPVDVDGAQWREVLLIRC